MTQTNKVESTKPTATSSGARLRPCLTCEVPFESTWVGERICRRCKCKNTWKNGVPLEATRQNNHRRGHSSSS